MDEIIEDMADIFLHEVILKATKKEAKYIVGVLDEFVNGLRDYNKNRCLYYDRGICEETGEPCKVEKYELLYNYQNHCLVKFHKDIEREAEKGKRGEYDERLFKTFDVIKMRYQKKEHTMEELREPIE